MRFVDYLVEGDVIDLSKRRAERVTQDRSQKEDEMARVIDQMDHDIARAIDGIKKIVGNDMEAYEIIANHLAIMYDLDVQDGDYEGPQY